MVPRPMTTHPQSVFERAVEAAADALVETSGGFGPDDNRVISSAIVRAVLMAVREADEGMIEAGREEVFKDRMGTPRRPKADVAIDVYRAMIDAILAQQEE